MVRPITRVLYNKYEKRKVLNELSKNPYFLIWDFDIQKQAIIDCINEFGFVFNFRDLDKVKIDNFYRNFSNEISTKILSSLSLESMVWYLLGYKVRTCWLSCEETNSIIDKLNDFLQQLRAKSICDITRLYVKKESLNKRRRGFGARAIQVMYPHLDTFMVEPTMLTNKINFAYWDIYGWEKKKKEKEKENNNE